MKYLKSHGIGSILGLSIESDIFDHKGGEGDDYVSNQFNKNADMVLNMAKDCIETTASTQPNSFVAIKITGILNPKTLQNINIFLNSLNGNFDKFERNGKLNYTDLRNIFKNIFLKVDHNDKGISLVVQKLFERFDLDNDGLIDWYDYMKIFSVDNLEIRNLLINNNNNNNNKNGEYLKQRDYDNYDKMISRL